MGSDKANALAAGHLPEQVVRALCDCGLLTRGGAYLSERLSGGVSSEIWRVESDGGVFCVKRALHKLAVAQDWYAPITRNRYERLWCQTVREHYPLLAPKILAHSDSANLFAMRYLDPSEYRNWKVDLAAGRVDVAFATSTAGALASIHAATSGRPDLEALFAGDEIFESIRLSPYLRATARVHPECDVQLNEIADSFKRRKLALVHGDVSPKNILVGPDGPVFIDSECACYGDPAFDVAFCLNHLLLKCMWVPARRLEFLDAFEAFTHAYFAGVAWESPAACEERAAALLPGLMLARVDGKSPVEYITSEADKNMVRGFAETYLRQPTRCLDTIAVAWREELA